MFETRASSRRHTYRQEAPARAESNAGAQGERIGQLTEKRKGGKGVLGQKIGFYAMTLLVTMVMSAGYGLAQSPAATDPKQQPQAPADPPPARLEGFGTLGQIPKFGGGNNIINSVITEDFLGRIGVGTREPGRGCDGGRVDRVGEPGGGYKFPTGPCCS